MEWQPIDTAPKDGTVIDLWMVDDEGREWREASAYWVTDQLIDPYAHKEGSRDGWRAPNHDYDGADGWCDEPRRYNPRLDKWIFTEPTHWMPIPAAPHSMPERLPND